MKAKFVPAYWPWRPFLHYFGMVAITMPWKSIYLLEDNAEIRSHELIHIEQMERDGPIWFCIRYVWWNIRRGYWDNPYEIEAYARELRTTEIAARATPQTGALPGRGDDAGAGRLGS
jgi:hypothetical protein